MAKKWEDASRKKQRDKGAFFLPSFLPPFSSLYPGELRWGDPEKKELSSFRRLPGIPPPSSSSPGKKSRLILCRRRCLKKHSTNLANPDILTYISHKKSTKRTFKFNFHGESRTGSLPNPLPTLTETREKRKESYSAPQGNRPTRDNSFFFLLSSPFPPKEGRIFLLFLSDVGVEGGV